MYEDMNQVRSSTTSGVRQDSDQSLNAFQNAAVLEQAIGLVVV